jgi:protein-S-isoprenylcysteine O-methyltransferase Ste14
MAIVNALYGLVSYLFFLATFAYAIAATAVLALLLWLWRPIAEPVLWSVNDPVARFVLNGVFWLGWGVLLISTFLINHFELFGLRQVWANLRGQALPAPVFHTPLFYRHVRHPIYSASCSRSGPRRR